MTGLLSKLPPRLVPTPHPFLATPSDEEILRMVAEPGGYEKYAAWLNMHHRLIHLASDDGDPFTYVFRPPHWHDADKLLVEPEIKLVYVSGGKRSGKSEWAAERFVKSAVRYPKMKVWVFQDSLATGVAMQHPLIWRYLPKEIKKLNERKSSVYKINYRVGRGFSENPLVLPNETEIYFLAYNQKVEDYQGWKLGKEFPPHSPLLDVKDPGYCPMIGAWMDENLTTKWLETIELRVGGTSAKMIWTYSTLEGITSTIKEVVGQAKTLRARKAELLPAARIAGLPRGYMPYIQKPNRKNTSVIYFHTDLNRFGSYWEDMKKQCEGRPTDYIERNAYGFARDTKDRAFPLFGAVNLVDPTELPAEGTNYMLTDPAGARNWATIWVRITDTRPSRFYIYRDWPDRRRYDEWAKPSEDPNNPDGDPGNAQRTLGYGYSEYKNKVFLAEERIITPATLFDPREIEPGKWEVDMEAQLARHIHDPYRRRLALEALKEGNREPLFEVIRRRLIDPRAGRNRQQAQKGGTCAIDELAKEQRDDKGNLVAPRMVFEPASGIDIAEGEAAINALLFWEHEEDYCPLLNEPRLYVSSECNQVRWALENYTGRGGEKAACKDFVDLLRYMATSGLRYVKPGAVKTGGGGAY